jgi:menaquinone-dependent protoporphyrinogen oxidase
MRVLVAYATRHGATRGIAERIADTLVRTGLEAVARSTEEPVEPTHYDAFVIGSAVYAFRWEKDATDFVRHNERLLSTRPVWLFSSGPLGPPEHDEHGKEVRPVPKIVAELSERIHPRDHHVFFGAYDPTAAPIGIIERLTRLAPAGKEALPVGDFRDWEEIEAWATRIAEELTPVAIGA